MNMSLPRTRVHWHIVTGEYPPQPGGVSDYTRLVARELARAGDEVHVWAPDCTRETPTDPGVTVTRLPGHFGPQALKMLSAALDRAPRSFRLLVQYVPHMYGYKAMNVPFCLWLSSRRKDAPWVMFHEVAFPVAAGQKLAHNFLGMVHRFMARIIVGAAERVFVSIPAWEPLLRGLAPRLGPVTWLPVPSNVSTHSNPGESAAIRSRLGVADNERIVGHFGTFGGQIAELLARSLPPLLGAGSARMALLVGRGSREFLGRLLVSRPDLIGRLHATGGVDADSVSNHLRACDLLVQPYPDGVSSRRGSVMTGLALGLPIVSTSGPATEPILGAAMNLSPWHLLPTQRLSRRSPCACSTIRSNVVDSETAPLPFTNGISVPYTVGASACGDSRSAAHPTCAAA